MDRIVIPMKNGTSIVAELYENPGFPKEICVFFEKDGEIAQDIALIREDEDNDSAEVLVWDDECDESYTHKFSIAEYKLN